MKEIIATGQELEASTLVRAVKLFLAKRLDVYWGNRARNLSVRFEVAACARPSAIMSGQFGRSNIHRIDPHIGSLLKEGFTPVRSEFALWSCRKRC